MRPPLFAKRANFLVLAVAFEGGLGLIALLLGWLTGVHPLAQFHFNWLAIGWALAATLPLALLFWVSYRFPVGSLRPIKRLLIETLGPYLAICRWYDLLFLALVAGVFEELLFRGFLQPYIESFSSPLLALIGSNLLFALAHAMTPTYALIAGLIGGYLGFLLDIGEQRNLLIPVAVHTLYDFFAFMVVMRAVRAAAPSRVSGEV